MKKLLLLLLFGLTSQLTLAQPGPTPTNLNVNVTSPSAICLQWTPNVAAAIVYEVERSDDGRTNWTKIGDSDPVASGAFSAGNYCDENLPSSRRYFYRVRGVSGPAYTSYSNVAEGTTGMAPAAPPTPTVAVVSGSALRITWSTRFGITYELVRREPSGRTTLIYTQNSGRSSGLTFEDTGLASGTEYCYQVRIRDSSQGTSPYSAVACATTTAAAPVPPVTPGPLSIISVSPSQLQLFWADVNVQAVTFEISRADNPGGTYRVIQFDYVQKIFDDRNLPASTQYCYRVRAKNSAGVYSGYSNEACGTTKAAPVIVPDPPTNLVATVLSPEAIKLSWTATTSTFGTGYRLERATAPGGAYSTAADLAANQTTFTDTGLSPNTRYCYRVRTNYNATLSDPGNEVCATTQAPAPTVPNAPIRLSATAVAFDQVNLGWADVSDNETGFEIEQSTDSITFNRVGTVGANVTTYQATGLNGSTKYYYRVRAVNAVGPSGYSNVVVVMTPAAPVPPPSAPTGLGATAVLATQINLAWTNTATNATGYEVDQSPDGTGNWIKIGDVPANATTYQNTGLTPNTRYYYRVRAVNQGGSATSNVANAITPDVAPGAPGRLTATAASATQIDLTWADGSGNETGFEIQQSPDGIAWTKLIDVPANTNTYRHEGLRPVTRYYYRVRAVNAIGPSAFSDPASATTLDVPPGAPTNLVARASSFSAIVLTWTNSATNVVGIDIEQSLDGISFRKVGTVGPTATTYTDAGLTPATRYYYRIQAINTVGPSGYSTVADAITPDVAPASPIRLTATATSYSAVSLSWGDASGNETGFEIEQSSDGGTTFNRVGTVGANVTTYQQTGLNGSTKYYYRVRAVNAIGPSGYASVVDVTTPQAPLPSVPTNLTAVPVEFDLIKLTWSPVSANTTSVVIERSTSSTGGFVEIGQQVPGKTEFGDVGVLPIATYYYRIKAVNSAGSSDYSNVAKVDAEAIIDAVPEPLTAGHSVYVADRTLFVKAGRPAEATIQVFNLQGLLVFDRRATLDAGLSYQYPITHLPAGLYVVAVQTAGSTLTKKILLP